MCEDTERDGRREDMDRRNHFPCGRVICGQKTLVSDSTTCLCVAVFAPNGVDFFTFLGLEVTKYPLHITTTSTRQLLVLPPGWLQSVLHSEQQETYPALSAAASANGASGRNNGPASTFSLAGAPTASAITTIVTPNASICCGTTVELCFGSNGMVML
jgi:hypothetical protein